MLIIGAYHVGEDEKCQDLYHKYIIAKQEALCLKAKAVFLSFINS
jgi:hypothetical protein